MSKTRATFYKIKSHSALRGKRLALISDLHSENGRDISQLSEHLTTARPDFILAAGDIFERLNGSRTLHMAAGLELLALCSSLAPTFYSIGNHENGGTRSWDKLKWRKIKSIERYYDPHEIELIKATGVHILDDEYTELCGICFGGLTSGLINESREPHTAWIDGFCAQSGAKVLLCHHPEYYKKYLEGKDIDLIASGHAHGGQWRILGRGVFAPGQGLFPRYTSGVHDGKLVISRGLKPSGTIPRIFNPPEVVFIDIE